MAEPQPLSPGAPPTREALAHQGTLLLTAVWVRWLDAFARDTQARLAALEARVQALEEAP